MKRAMNRILGPVRKLAARFVDVGASRSEDSIMHKAAAIIAAEKVEGDYLEFGVFAGASFIQSYHTIQRVFEQHQQLHEGRTENDASAIAALWSRMRFFAFDSFQGLPELEGFDRETSDFSKGKYSCTEDRFRENLRRAGVPMSKLVTVPGWFSESCSTETIRRHELSRASIIHIDCDLYESTATVLKFVKPLLTDGSIIVFDDWYCFRGNPGLGEQRAFNEWKATMSGWVFTEFQKEGPWRNSFIANRAII